MNNSTEFRLSVEADINRMLAKTARKLRAAINNKDTEEIERILKLMESGLEPD